MITDESIFYAINSPDITDFECSDELIGTHIFKYNQNPNTLKRSSTFITLQVHISKQYDYSSSSNWVKPTLEIWIYSHEGCMEINNIPGIDADRNDYIGQLLDAKFNGRTNFGVGESTINLIGQLELVDSSEGAFSKDYLYRKLTFVTKDISKSFCGN